MTGMEEGLFPHSRSVDEERLEEEPDNQALTELRVLGRYLELNEQISQIWVIAQEFEDDTSFDMRVECARDADALSGGGMGGAGS